MKPINKVIEQEKRLYDLLVIVTIQAIGRIDKNLIDYPFHTLELIGGDEIKAVMNVYHMRFHRLRKLMKRYYANR